MFNSIGVIFCRSVSTILSFESMTSLADNFRTPDIRTPLRSTASPRVSEGAQLPYLCVASS